MRSMNPTAVEENRSPDARRIAIQGEPGSNSHLAATTLFGDAVPLLPCATSAEVFEQLAAGNAGQAVLPIENSLHGAVFEHYDLLLQHNVCIVGEMLLRIRHNVIAAPGVGLGEIRRVISHPVALSQCRRWLRAHPAIEVVPTYDTAGSVKQLMAQGWRDVAGIAPVLAATVYRAAVLVEGVEDHAENYTRFYVLQTGVLNPAVLTAGEQALEGADKMSVAFTLEHRPGTLLRALQAFAQSDLNLTKIESRPVPGRPWEYVFFVDVGFTADVTAAVGRLREACSMVKVLGLYRSA